jgi:MFS family permease
MGIPLSFVIRNRSNGNSQVPKEVEGIASPDVSGEIRFTKAIRDRMFLFLNFVEFIRFMTVSAAVLHIMPYLSSVGIPRQVAGVAAAAIPLCSIIGRIGLGWLGDVFDKRIIMATSCGLMSLGMFSFCYATNEWFLGIFLFLFSPGWGGLTVLRGSILREYYGKESFGKMIGILMGSASIGGIIGPTLTGWFFDTMDSYYSIWLTFAVLLFVMMIMTIIVTPRRATHKTRTYTV